MIKLSLITLNLWVAITLAHQGRAQTVISSVPYSITKAGTYTLGKNLTYSGTGNAITVNASGVTLDFNGHVLKATNSATTTIGVQLADPSGNTKNVIVQNGTIQNFVHAISADAGIAGQTYSAIVVQDMRLYAPTGVHISGGTGCTIQRNLVMSTGSGSGSVIDLIQSTGQILLRDNQVYGNPEFAIFFNNAPANVNSYFVNNFVINGLTGFVFETDDKYRFNIADLCSTPYSSGIPLNGASN
jgi:hypothetical protein